MNHYVQSWCTRMKNKKPEMQQQDTTNTFVRTCDVFLAVAAFCLRTSSSILLIDRKSLLFFLRMAFWGATGGRGPQGANKRFNPTG